MNLPKIALASLLVLRATRNELNDRQCNRNHALKSNFTLKGYADGFYDSQHCILWRLEEFDRGNRLQSLALSAVLETRSSAAL